MRIKATVFMMMLLSALPIFGRGKLQGYVEQGGNTVSVAGFVSTTKVQRSFPSATVTVYLSGTTTLATLYTTSAGTSKANPFTAGSDASWFFYTDASLLDVKFSGTSAGITTPFTWSALAPVNNAGGVVFDIRDFGALCDGTTDDTASIQAAIAAAQLLVPTVNVYQPQANAVHITGGSTGCKITSTLTVTKPIRIYGDGKESSLILITSTFNAPAIKISLTAGQSTYIIFQLDHFAIKGPNTFSGFVTQDASDGILVSPTAPGSDTTVEITDMRITGMTGNGIQLYEAVNSPRIARSEIEINSKAGIRADTATSSGFVSNADIDGNYIRENREGIVWKSSNGATLNTGRIRNNLIESNTKGVSGTLGSADRPSVGLHLYAAQSLLIEGNYIEAQWNDIYCEVSCASNVFSNNTLLFGNSYALATTYGPPARRPGVWWYSGTENRWYGNSFISPATQPGGCSNANWTPADASGYASTYPQITDDQGVNSYLYSKCPNCTFSQVNIANYLNRHTIVGTEVDTIDGSRELLTEKLWGRQEDYAQFSILKGATTDSNQIRTVMAVGQSTLSLLTQHQDATTSNHVSFRTKGGSGGTMYEYMTVNPFGIDSMLWALGSARFQWSYAAAAPVSGAHTIGEIVWNTVPAASGNIGWVCTTAGTPGTWKSWGTIAP